MWIPIDRNEIPLCERLYSTVVEYRSYNWSQRPARH